MGMRMKVRTVMQGGGGDVVGMAFLCQDSRMRVDKDSVAVLVSAKSANTEN